MIDREKIKADINSLITQNNRLLTQIKSKAKAIQTKDSDLEIFIRDNIVNKKDNKIINVATVTPEEANSTLKDMRILNKKIQDNVITIKMLTNKLTEKILSKKEAEYVRANIMATIYGQLSMTIQGRTVTNILGSYGSFEVDSDLNGVADGWYLSGATGSLIDGWNGKAQQVKSAGVATNYFYISTDSDEVGTDKFKPSTYYAILGDIKIINTENTDSIYLLPNNSATFNDSATKISKIPDITKLNIVQTIGTKYRTQSSISRASHIAIAYLNGTATTNAEFHLDNVRIVEISEYDYNNLSIDELYEKYPFHNGTKSVSPDLAIVGTNKNLLYSEFREGYYTDFDTMTSTTSEVYVSTYPIHIKAGTYTFSSANPIRMVRMYDSLGESYTTGVDFPATITIPYDCEIVMSFRRAESPNTIWNLGDSTSEASIQLEEGSMVTEYIRHDKNVVYFSDIGELRSVGDVYDEINVTEGKYIQRIGVDETDPGDPTFSRSSVAYLSDGTQVAANVPRFEPGKFGQAVLVEEGTTNLLLYSQDFTQSVWNKRYVDVSSAGTYLGYPATRFTPNTPGQVSWVTQTFLASGAANRTFTWSFWARGQTNRQFRVNFYGGVSKTFAVYTINLTTEWQKFTITHTFPSEATSARIQWGNILPYWGFDYTDWIEVAGVQVEEKPYATSYIKTTSTTATRSSETLTIPTAGVLNKDEGTIELWINPITAQNWNQFFSMSISTGRFLLYFSSAGVVFWDYGPINSGLMTGTGVAVAGQWLHVAMRWSASKGSRELFVNGQYIGTKSFTPPDRLPATVSIVNNYGALIDDLRISSHARTDQEIVGAYNSGAPLPVDEYTSYKLGFDDNLNKERATPLIYQLETPIISDVDPAIIVDMVNRYTLSYHSRLKNYSSNITFDYPLETIDRVEDIDNKEIDLSKVHLAADGLSVTIDDAMPGDEFRIYGPYKQGYFVEPTLQIVT